MMAEAKDPTIKLFGKTIPLLENDFIDNKHTSSVNNNNLHVVEDISSQEIDNNDKGDQDGTICQIEESEVSFQRSHKSMCQDPSPILTDNVKTFSIANEKIASELSKLKEEKLDTSTSQEKTLKKPDKIISCPRCNSMDTKFCYYNNYNANQPRHFCKKCQRYWTAGGTMRNVPVGAGRRKNKSSASHYRQMNVSEALENRPDILNGFHRGLQTNGRASTFELDSPLCESMASILSLAEKTMRNFSDANGLQKHGDLKVQIPFVPMETRVEYATNSSPKESVPQSCHHYSQITCYPRPSWPYPWSSAQWTPPTTAPPFCPNNLAVPFYPTPSYWGCMVPATWNNPWITQPYPMSKSSPSSGPNSPLGKHSRDGNMITLKSSEEKEIADVDRERSLWIPKTSRIDDRGEGTKSSTWTGLNMKNCDKSGSIGEGLGLFRAFQLKCDEKTPMLETSTLMEANPTSLSRSQNM